MIYIALLQGINVGKHNRIKMEDLKHLFQSRGLKRVQTYIQSGNVLFESDKDEEFLSKMIEREIMIIYNYVVPVVIRSMTELEQAIKNCPFSKNEIKEAELATGEDVYVSFLKYDITPDKIEILKKYNEEGTEFRIVGREVYLLFSNRGIRNSKLAKNIHMIDIHATMRNLRTVKKLVSLTKVMKLE